MPLTQFHVSSRQFLSVGSSAEVFSPPASVGMHQPCQSVNITFTDMQMQAYQRTYPYPQSWNSNYPVLWIEKILYPLQVYGSQYAPPSTAPTASAIAGTGLSVQTYSYQVTFLTQGGETPSGSS